jgi:hypothetical protein
MKFLALNLSEFNGDKSSKTFLSIIIQNKENSTKIRTDINLTWTQKHGSTNKYDFS